MRVERSHKCPGSAVFRFLLFLQDVTLKDSGVMVLDHTLVGVFFVLSVCACVETLRTHAHNGA